MEEALEGPDPNDKEAQMSIIAFMKDAGERLFNRPHAAPAASQAPARSAAHPAGKPDVDALEARAARAIKDYVASKGLPVQGIDLDYDANSSTVTVSGTVPDQATREKIVVCCGNVASVEHVDDRLSVASAGKPGDFYTVKSGDTLSEIAKRYYGDANRYSAIFEANKPMLDDPDKIYPGQVLRVPRLS
jgi:nucleoid-associated protein YgaU